MKRKILKFPNSEIPLETQIHAHEMAAMEAMIGHRVQDPEDNSCHSGQEDPKDGDEK